MTDFDAPSHLKSISGTPDTKIDLGRLAVAMVSCDHEGLNVDRYFRHFEKVSDAVAVRYKALCDGGGDDDVGTRLAALKYVLSDTYDYRKTEQSFEILESADILRVIDRGQGGASALCLLYMDAARKNGWHIEGLNFPSHFLCRLEKDGVRYIFDPTQQCKVLEAHDLRGLLKDTLGNDAELSSHYFDGFNGLQTVVHLCNRLKSRRIEMSDYQRALNLVERMRVIVPDEYRLLLDAGVLYARTGQRDEAVTCLNAYIEDAPNHMDRQAAYMLLQELCET